jgi:hypothetical protein
MTFLTVWRKILELARIGLRVRLQRDAVFLRVWERYVSIRGKIGD